MSEEAMTDYLTPVPVSPTNKLVAYSAAGAVYAELPARRRAFLCTKCGGRDCEPETLGQVNPTCKCGYLGFAEDLDFTVDDLRDFADRTHAIRAPHGQAPASVKSIELQIAEALRTKGLTLVKTATGYDVLKLGEVTAQQATPSPQAHSGEPVGEVVWAAGVPNSIREVHLKKWDLPIGTKLYTAPACS